MHRYVGVRPQVVAVVVRPLQRPLPRETGCRLGLLGRGGRGDRTFLLLFPSARLSGPLRLHGPLPAGDQSPAKAGSMEIRKTECVSARARTGAKSPGLHAAIAARSPPRRAHITHASVMPQSPRHAGGGVWPTREAHGVPGVTADARSPRHAGGSMADARSPRRAGGYGRRAKPPACRGL